jgi:phosphate transport system ATP-binding protein
MNAIVSPRPYVHAAKVTLAPRPPVQPLGSRGSPAVDVRGFSFFYGPRQALKNLNFAIERRAVTAIIGPSGCGKSTFLRSINRLNDLIPGIRHQGDILVEGTSVFGSGTDLVALRQRVGMVFQRPNPFPKTVFDNVAYGPALNALVTKRDLPDLVERCLRHAALWDEVKDRLDELGTGLSGGQQQRLCIARTLAVEPEVILMDEPCSALDPIATARVEDLMDDLKAEYTIVIVTHNMQQARRTSDMTACLMLDDAARDGQRIGIIAEFSPTDLLFTTPADPRTEAYITGRIG